MELQHSPGLWHVDDGYSWGNTGKQFAVCNDNDALLVTTVTGRDEANARRVVACVNALAGVSTEELEQTGFIGGLREAVECSIETKKNMEGRLKILLVKHAALKLQRDELLAALKLCVPELRGWMNCYGEDLETIAALKASVSAIENSKGGAL